MEARTEVRDFVLLLNSSRAACHFHLLLTGQAVLCGGKRFEPFLCDRPFAFRTPAKGAALKPFQSLKHNPRLSPVPAALFYKVFLVQIADFG